MTVEQIKEEAEGDAGGLGYAVERNEFYGTYKEYIAYLNAYINCCNYYEYDNADYDEVVQRIRQFEEMNEDVIKHAERIDKEVEK